MKRFLSVAVILILQGCASAPTTMTINADNVEPGLLLANIVTQRAEKPMPGLMQVDYSTWIIAIQGEDKRRLYQGGAGKGSLAEVNLPAGKYEIEAVCANGFGTAKPKLNIELKPSKKYRLRCSVYTGKNIIGMKVDSHAEITLDDLEEVEKTPVHWP